MLRTDVEKLATIVHYESTGLDSLLLLVMAAEVHALVNAFHKIYILREALHEVFGWYLKPEAL